MGEKKDAYIVFTFLWQKLRLTGAEVNDVKFHSPGGTVSFPCYDFARSYEGRKMPAFTGSTRWTSKNQNWTPSGRAHAVTELDP